MTGSAEAAADFGWNIVGSIAIITWTGALCFIMFYSLKKMKMLRVESGHEFTGTGGSREIICHFAKQRIGNFRGHEIT